MTDQMNDALEVCLQALNAGASVEDCLRLYPELTPELQPVLEAAMAARSLSVDTIPAGAMNRSRTHLLARATRLRSERRSWKGLLRLPRLAFSAVLVVLFLLVTSSGLLAVSAQSLPGDTLYPVKRVVEDLRYQLAPSGETRHVFEAGYSQKRIDEVERLLDLGRAQRVTFEGVVEKISMKAWIVSGIPVVLTPETLLIGEIEIGLLIEVEGETQPDGTVVAHELHLREYELSGQVQLVEANRWVVSGIEFVITPDTQIDAGAQIGDTVIALVRSEDDGFLYALAILRLLQPTLTPKPTQEPTILPMTTPQPITQSTEEHHETEFTGQVETISDVYWIVSGQVVYLTAQTEVGNGIGVGDTVKVHAVIESNDSWSAREIELVNDDGDSRLDDQPGDDSGDGVDDDSEESEPGDESDDPGQDDGNGTGDSGNDESETGGNENSGSDDNDSDVSDDNSGADGSDGNDTSGGD